MEFKTGFGEIVEFRPNVTKAQNHIFLGNLQNKVLFFSNEKNFPQSNIDPEGSFVQ